MALTIKDRSVHEIVQSITFDSVAPKLKFEEVDNLFNFVNKNLCKNSFHGIGLEVGGGCGFFSALLAKSDSIEKMYTVEVCESIVLNLMPKVVSEIAGKDANKVIGCIGDFDNIQLGDNSVDFVFDFFSLHHSDDLKITLKELYRILKPGGHLICFDKARSNDLSDNELNNLLDTEYNDEAKRTMGILVEKYHTRRMNGEKEYRLKDWREQMESVGFEKFKHFHIAKIVGSRISVLFKTVLSILPIKIEILITNILSFKKGNKNNLEIHNRVYTSLINNFAKEISFISVQKITDK